MTDADVRQAPYHLVATRTAVREVEAVDRMGAGGVSLALREWKAERAIWVGAALPDEARERLIELSQLTPDWDSYGALRPVPHAIARSGTLISRVIARVGPQGAPQEIMPIADGGVSLEWRYPSVELGLNACPEGGWSYLLVEKDGSGRRSVEGYDLPDEDALELIFGVTGDHNLDGA